ncbi:MAG: cadmium-translocating P-type ATPase [Clostridia bacterium]|nr:cadmium-translocating P-type ATPase [Clostridia bacterium]
MNKKQKKLLFRISISLGLFIVTVILEKLFNINSILLLVMYLVPYIISGYDVLLGFFKNITHGRVFDEKLLMTVATLGALIIGEYPECVFVMVFYQTGELFQSVAVGKSRRSISSLMELCPDEAVVLRDGTEETVFPDEVETGETVIVRPGEKIPLDGIVLEGEAAVDMSALTGESAPFDTFPGCEVKAGSINLTSTLKIEVQKEAHESTAAKILELVENSSLNKAKTEKFLTRFSRYYTPAVVISALILAVVPSLITGDWREWVYRALIFLVVSCPCALVISVPLSYFGGIGGASSNGILIKGANYLEALGNVSTFVFDKTGTLTTGEFTVSGIFPEEGTSSEELLHFGATAEYYSNHPIAKSIVKAAGDICAPESVKEHSGFGVEAKTEKGTIFAGSKRFLEKSGISLPENENSGTGVYIAFEGTYKGFIKLSDTPKKNINVALDKLRKSGVSGFIMLTGDNESAAGETAEKLGIADFYAGLLPDDKANFLEKLCKEKKGKETVAFVGDGINDAPVLALSDVGFAMGGVGSDAAIEAADIVIMDDNIEKCALGVKIAKKTKRIVLQNVVFALGVKFAVLFFASFGLTNMWIGVLADVGVAVLAILNAMRTLKIKE